MSGGTGNDTYRVDDGADCVIEAAGRGSDRILAATSYTLAADAEIEFLQASGSGAVTLSGNGLRNAVLGNLGADILHGMAGDDSLSGAEGDDRLFGGMGRDTMAGGAGKDIFVFDSAVAKRKNANIDALSDFNVKDDTIYLENAVFKALGRKGSMTRPAKLANDGFFHGERAHDANDHIIVTRSGKIFYDADGTGHQAQIQIGSVAAKVARAMTEKDFMIV
jgi:Ca2+-binding RTX toxin-like protein